MIVLTTSRRAHSDVVDVGTLGVVGIAVLRLWGGFGRHAPRREGRREREGPFPIPSRREEGSTTKLVTFCQILTRREVHTRQKAGWTRYPQSLWLAFLRA